MSRPLEVPVEVILQLGGWRELHSRWLAPRVRLRGSQAAISSELESMSVYVCRCVSACERSVTCRKCVDAEASLVVHMYV